MGRLSIEEIGDLEGLERQKLVSLTKDETVIVVKKGEKADKKDWESIRKQLKSAGFKYISQGTWRCSVKEGKLSSSK